MARREATRAVAADEDAAGDRSRERPDARSRGRRRARLLPLAAASVFGLVALRDRRAIFAADVYARFAGGFDRDHAARFPLAYAVVHDERAERLANLDRWYEREAAGRVGRYSFYRLRLKP